MSERDNPDSAIAVAQKSSQAAAAETELFDSWEDRAGLLRVMAHPVRLMILEKLCGRPHCVKHLNSLIDITQPQLSQHMAALRKAKLIACHACGPVRCYYISQPTLVTRIIQLLREDQQYLEMDCESIVAQARQGWEEEIRVSPGPR